MELEFAANLVWVAVVAVLLSLLLRSRGISTAIPLLIAGAGLGLLPVGPNAPAEPEAIQALILAPLVFGEALSSSYIDLKRVRRPVLGLAIGLVAVTTLVVGGVVASVAGAMPLAMAFALGAVLAPTDAVAVAAAARRANLPQRLVSILEGESLVNDGTGLTALRVATVAAVAGSVTVGQAGLILLQSVVVAIIVGGLAGLILVTVIRRSTDVVGIGGLLLIAPFGLYIVTERLGGSSILAIVIAALMASHASASDPSYRGRLHTAAVWRQITFILQSIAFLLLGLELPDAIVKLSESDRALLLVLVPTVVITLIVTRLTFVVGAFGLDRLRRTPATHSLRSALVVGWAGARGPVSALAAFSIPLLTATGEALPYRDLVIAVSLTSIAVMLALSLTLAPLATRLKVEQPPSAELSARIDAALARAALGALEDAQDDADRAGHPLAPEVVRSLRRSAEHRLDSIREGQAPEDGLRAKVRGLAVAMAQAEQQELLRLRTEEGLPDTAVRAKMVELDRRISTLRSSS
ncbi:MAG: cation:proton antiporter [Actinobacteria bacterium]|nr:cation:proton antiporter [Actinomycetota bacterium]